MTIDATSFTTTTTSASSSSLTGSDVEETKQQFLQMLITQLQNQDPLSPMDANQFSQQMISLGQLEQLLDLNTNVANMAAAQQGALVSQYSDIVGRDVLALGNQFQVSSSNPGIIQFSLASTPQDVTVNVFDSYGNLVRDFTPGITTSGTHTIAFDGLDNQGAALAYDYYTYTVDAVDAEATPITTTTYSEGQISSIGLDNGTPTFQMGSVDVALTDIQKIF